jgi:hypothetical protein
MKNLITSLCLLVFTLSFGQASTIKKNSDFESFGIKVEVDSAEDLEKTFKIENIKDLLSITTVGQDITLQIICNGEKMSNGVNSSLSFKIKGNTSKQEEFIADATKIRKMALKHFNSK